MPVQLNSPAAGYPVSGDGVSLQSKVAGQADFKINSHVTPFFGVDDEVWKIIYNDENTIPTEPGFSIRFETNYQTTHKNAQVRTTEHYLQLTGPISQIDGGVVNGQFRPWFFSFSPNDISGGKSGELAYGYLQTGKYRAATSGGGGLTITAGDENSNGGVMVFDCDGSHAIKPILAQNPAPIGITSATAGANCAITFAASHPFEAGSNLTVFAYAAGEWSPQVVTDVTAVAGLVVTTALNNTGNAYIPTTPAEGSYGARLPHDVGYQVVATKIGVGRAIRTGDTDKLSVAGPASFYGKTYHVKPGSAKTLSGAALMGFSSPATDFQHVSFSNTSQAYSFGYLSGNTATFGFGPGQSTDASFTGSNSIISFDAANQSVGIGGSVAGNFAYLRVRGGTSSKAPVHINNQTDSADPPTPTGGVVIYAKAGALYAKGSAGTVTLIAPA